MHYQCMGSQALDAIANALPQGGVLYPYRGKYYASAAQRDAAMRYDAVKEKVRRFRFPRQFMGSGEGMIYEDEYGSMSLVEDRAAERRGRSVPASFATSQASVIPVATERSRSVVLEKGISVIPEAPVAEAADAQPVAVAIPAPKTNYLVPIAIAAVVAYLTLR